MFGSLHGYYYPRDTNSVDSLGFDSICVRDSVVCFEVLLVLEKVTFLPEQADLVTLGGIPPAYGGVAQSKADTWVVNVDILSPYPNTYPNPSANSNPDPDPSSNSNPGPGSSPCPSFRTWKPLSLKSVNFFSSKSGQISEVFLSTCRVFGSFRGKKNEELKIIIFCACFCVTAISGSRHSWSRAPSGGNVVRVMINHWSFMAMETIK